PRARRLARRRAHQDAPSAARASWLGSPSDGRANSYGSWKVEELESWKVTAHHWGSSTLQLSNSPTLQLLLADRSGLLRGRIGPRQAHRDDLRDAGGLHRHAVENVGRLHAAFVVGDTEYLGALRELAKQRGELLRVVIVYGGSSC